MLEQAFVFPYSRHKDLVNVLLTT